jgi:hypothetical protein
MILYCKPYYKSTYEKKGGMGNVQPGLNNGGNYNETISKPSFLLKENEKEVYLNGEIVIISNKEVPNFGGNGTRKIKKTMVCLKCLQVDDNLRQQAMRNVFNRN